MSASAAASSAGVFPVAECSCTVLSNRQVNRRYKLIALRAAEPFTRARAVQFFHLLCPQQAELRPFLRRPMSVYGVRPDERAFAMSVHDMAAVLSAMRRRIVCRGLAGHSGAVPRWLRQDPVFALADLLVRIDEHWQTLQNQGVDLAVTSTTNH